MSHSKLLVLVVGLYTSCIFLCAVFSVTLVYVFLSVSHIMVMVLSSSSSHMHNLDPLFLRVVAQSDQQTPHPIQLCDLLHPP